MTTYLQTENRAVLLEKSRQEGGIYIRRDDGLLFLLTPEGTETQPERSPFDIAGVNTGLTREEIVDAVHDGRGNHR